MAMDTISRAERRADWLPNQELAQASCSLDVLAQAIAALTSRSPTPSEVRQRAIALGLLQMPEDGTVPRLTARAASRLLLAGCQLPAWVGSGSIDQIPEFLGQGLRVLAPVCTLDNPSARPTTLLQLHDVPCGSGEGGWVCVGEPAAPVLAIQQMTLGRFLQGWSAADQMLLVAAHAWQELPREGRHFFGGSRDADGSYHWDIAECVTDGCGRILRC